MATLTMEVSRASMNVARVTVMAMTQGLALGRHVSWNVSVAAAKNDPFWVGLKGVGLSQIISWAYRFDGRGWIAG
jgi:hypothetical protein